MKKLLLTTLIAISSTMMILTGCSSNPEQIPNIETTKSESVTENKTENETELAKEKLTESITEPIGFEYTEDEYKNLCQELYYDDFFDDEPDVGQYVKFYGFISGKGQYTFSSNFRMIIKNIDDKYNFNKKYLTCCVMHEETKNDYVPSYFGYSVYLMFPSDTELDISCYDSGQKIVVYGEVVQTLGGIFIIPKYIEEE